MPLVRQSGSRALVLGVLVALCATAGTVLAPFADAQTTSSASDLRAQADALSSKYFSALERVSSLDDDIAHSEEVRDDLLARANATRACVGRVHIFRYATRDPRRGQRHT